MTGPWQGVIWTLLLATVWLGGLGAVRLLAARQVSTSGEARDQKRLAALALTLAAVGAAGVIALLAADAWN